MAENLVLRLIARTSAFDRNMNKSRTKVRSMSVSIGALAKSAIALGAAYKAVDFTKTAIKNAARAEEIGSKFKVVFKEMTLDAEEWANDFGLAVGRSQNDLREWMATLQDTFVPLGLARDEAFGLSKSLTELAVDVASFNNKLDADVIRDFTSALVGNHETVRKYGVIVSQSTIEQEMMRQGMHKTFNQLTDLEKVQLRYNIILNGTADAQGDAARTSDSYTNQMKRLKAQWEDFSVTLGQKLIPALTAVLEKMNKLFPQDKRTSLEVLQDQLKDVSHQITIMDNSLGNIDKQRWLGPIGEYKNQIEALRAEQEKLILQIIKVRSEAEKPATDNGSGTPGGDGAAALDYMPWRGDPVEISKTSDSMRVLNRELDANKLKWQSISWTMENSMVSAMERIEFENGKLADGIKSVARSVLVEWQRVFIFQRTAQAATGFLSTIATNIAGAFAAPAVTPNAPGNMALQPNRLQGFAGGGVSDRPAIFGDGPGSEAAVPLPDGRSIPVKLEGGGVPNVTVINNGTPQQVTDTQSIMENGQAFLGIWTEDFVNEGQGTFGVIQNSKGL